MTAVHDSTDVLLIADMDCMCIPVILLTNVLLFKLYITQLMLLASNHPNLGFLSRVCALICPEITIPVTIKEMHPRVCR